jgi:branched-chain amino acid transport system substrate-binding protein
MVEDNRRSFLKIAGASGVVGLTGLAGCSGGDGGDGGTSPTETDSGGSDGSDGGGGSDGSDGGSSDGGGGGTLTIGYITFLSGPVAAAGTANRRGMEIGVDQINADGGANGVEFEVFVEDSQASPDTAINRARRLLNQEGADMIIAAGSSAVAKALNQFLAQQGVPMVTAAPQTPDITKSECRETTFRITSNIINQQKSVAASADEIAADDVTEVVSINPDYVFGQQSADVFQEEFTNLRSDAEITEQLFPAFLKGDYAQEIQTIANADPDMIHTSLFGGDIIAFIQQGQQFDLFQQVEEITFSSPTEPALALQGDMVEAICSAPASFKWPNDRTRAFSDEYIDRHDTIPFGFWSMYGRAVVDAIAAALEETGGDTSSDALVSAFSGLTFSSVVPDTTIRESDHHAEMEAMLSGRIGLLDEQPLPDSQLYSFTDPRELTYEQVADDDISCSF